MKRKLLEVPFFFAVLVMLGGAVAYAQDAALQKHRPSVEELIRQLPKPEFNLIDINKDDLPKVEKECKRLSKEEGQAYRLVIGKLRSLKIKRKEVELCTWCGSQYYEAVQKYAGVALRLNNSNLFDKKREVTVFFQTYYNAVSAAPLHKGGQYAVCALNDEGFDNPAYFAMSPKSQSIYHIKNCFFCLF